MPLVMPPVTLPISPIPEFPGFALALLDLVVNGHRGDRYERSQGPAEVLSRC
jgi:hypothetical protein